MLLGRQKRAVVRPPLTKIGDAEIARIRQALLESACCARKPTPRRRVASGAMRDTHRTGSCGAMRLLVAVRHLERLPEIKFAGAQQQQALGARRQGRIDNQIAVGRGVQIVLVRRATYVPFAFPHDENGGSRITRNGSA